MIKVCKKQILQSIASQNIAHTTYGNVSTDLQMAGIINVAAAAPKGMAILHSKISMRRSHSMQTKAVSHT
jgi:hypothetical protein